VTDERETLDVDVLFVGAGPASLAGAIHLGSLRAAAKERGESVPDLSVAVVEKSGEIGGHALSGAVLDPVALSELVPDYREKGAPIECDVGTEALYFLTRRRRLKAPLLPPPFKNHGNHVVSLNKLVRWMAKIAEEKDVQVFPGFPAAELLFDGERVAGVRTRDQGVGKDGRKKPGYQAGVDIRARVTILGEGPRGTLSKVLVRRHRLDEGKNPQIYATGVKEVWEVAAGRIAPGRVIHTAGYPLGNRAYGGGFVYGMKENLVSLGLVVGLDHGDPTLDPHHEFQRWKKHPLLREILDGGRVVNYGAKTIPEGGYFAIPRPYTDGCLLVGDSAGLLNAQRLKGIHLGMKSGMLAAETALEAVKTGDASATALSSYWEKLDASIVGRELFRCRNFRQAFSGKPFWRGFVASAAQFILGGRGFRARLTTHRDHEYYRKLAPGADYPEDGFRPDKSLTFDKLTDLYFSGTQHEQDQPCHLVVADTDVCATKCVVEYGNPCRFFCPAHVYEMVEQGSKPKGSGKALQINAENCVHCKTCDIADPYQIITWVPPEGGGGPNYAGM